MLVIFPFLDFIPVCVVPNLFWPSWNIAVLPKWMRNGFLISHLQIHPRRSRGILNHMIICRIRLLLPSILHYQPLLIFKLFPDCNDFYNYNYTTFNSIWSCCTGVVNLWVRWFNLYMKVAERIAWLRWRHATGPVRDWLMAPYLSAFLSASCWCRYINILSLWSNLRHPYSGYSCYWLQQSSLMK